MCRLQPRLTKATIKEIVDGPWPSDGQDTRFTADVLPTLPHEKRTPEQDSKGVSRGVSDGSVCFPPSIRPSNPIFTSNLFF